MSGSGEKFVVNLQSVATEADECDGVHPASSYMPANCIDGDAGCAVGRKRVDAGADGGEGHGADVVLLGEFKAAAVAACEEIVFAPIASVPDGADGVEYPFGWEIEAGGDLYISGSSRGVRGRRRGVRGPRRDG